MERRLQFSPADLAYLANLCHNCGECLYACQYAPPHEFHIDVPRTLAELRARSYEDYCWPRPLATAFRRHNLLTGSILAAGLMALMLVVTLAVNGGRLSRPVGPGDFYAVLPHGVMVALFGGVFLFALAALGVGVIRLWRDIAGGGSEPTRVADFARGLRHAMSLRHLRSGGEECAAAEDERTLWRRWLHHSTYYGFLGCFASTSVAAVYHTVFGWQAPYAYTSLPVVLGTAGGLALLVGTAGLLIERRRRDPDLADPEQAGLDESFIALLLVTALSGLLLLALRESAAMSVLLIVHLGAVLALFLTLPYGKFVHGVYRAAALVVYAKESDGARAE